MRRIAFVRTIVFCWLSLTTGVGFADQKSIRPGMLEETFENLKLENPTLERGTIHPESPAGEWVKEAGSGCLIWADYKVRGKVEWSGPCRDGKAHGTGVLVAFDGDDLEGTYEGEFRDGKRHGKGVLVWGPATPWNGDRYEGEFKDGLRHGQGIFIFANGDRYEGQFASDQFVGQDGARTAGKPATL